MINRGERLDYLAVVWLGVTLYTQILLLRFLKLDERYRRRVL